ncbi:cyclic nucleotide-dependent protein kinase [Skeletonema marinoi]|uniref:Cyclic nucleotide-dependent protein kinase n=1 Tax=Skeletonema marinoi TaxID=267567 RepID=A0AAD9DAL3_9STRA|nr:cyclic nucleotide-dependent protein kinase [Skeletonema marinoi]
MATVQTNPSGHTGGDESKLNDNKNTISLLKSILSNKPIDGSDITTLDDATHELKRIRQLMEQYNHHHTAAPASSSSAAARAKTKPTETPVQVNADKDKHGATHEPVVDDSTEYAFGQSTRQRRTAVLEKQHIKDYVKNSIPKQPHVRELILNAIKTNLLFQQNNKDELSELVDVFEPVHFNQKDMVFQQGDSGHDACYVVEQGQLSVYVSHNGGPYHMMGTYHEGKLFGEWALVYGSPHLATVVCDVDCKLWRIKRSWYRGVVGQYRQKLIETLTKKFLPKVFLPRNKEKIYFKNLFNPTQMVTLAGLTKQISFQEGDFIIRESEKGDTFYMIQKGVVDLFIKAMKDVPITALDGGKYFGERSLLQDDVRQATLRAQTDVTCFLLTREDVNRVIGSLEEILEHGFPPKRLRMSTIQRDEKVQYELYDLELFGKLGSGAFGEVRAAKAKQTEKYYALEMKSKSFIVTNGQEDAVMNEYSILRELDHPFIVRLHCAMQDEKYIYFLADIHHDLIDIMDQKGSFSEDCTRFYSASVLLAFQAMHSNSIVYRDLKPESLALDDRGYCIINDLGLAKKCEGHLYTFCGNPDYLAPEVIRGTGYNWGVDYWGLGVLIYELYTGTAPFESYDPTGTAKKILKGIVNFPDKVTGPMKDLIKALLTKDQTRRLGVLKGGTEDVMKHRFYTGFDWEGLLNMQIQAPFELQPVTNYKSLGTPDSQEDSAMPVVNWNPVFGE